MLCHRMLCFMTLGYSIEMTTGTCSQIWVWARCIHWIIMIPVYFQNSLRHVSHCIIQIHTCIFCWKSTQVSAWIIFRYRLLKRFLTQCQKIITYRCHEQESPSDTLSVYYTTLCNLPYTIFHNIRFIPS